MARDRMVISDKAARRSTLQRRTPEKITPLYTSAAASFYQVGSITGVLTIPGFGSVESFVPAMQAGFQAMHDAGLKHLIIDLSNNGGGELESGYALIDYLFPNTSSVPSQLYGDNDMIHSPLANELVKAAVQKPDVSTFWSPWNWFNPQTGLPFTSDDPWWFPGALYVRGNIPNNYTQKFRDDDKFALEELPPPPVDERFTPRAIRVLSNGFCGSTCAVFSRHLQEVNKVPNIVVGGLLRRPMGISTTPGGEVTDLVTILQQIDQLDQADNSLAPSNFPDTASMRFTIREIYPFKGPTDVPLEFFFQPATAHIPYTQQTATDPTLIWIEVADNFF